MRATGELARDYSRKLAKAQAFDVGWRGPEGSVSETLVKSQKAWVQVRDMNCLIENIGWWRGSGFGVAFKSCQARETLKRAAFLRTLDLSI